MTSQGPGATSFVEVRRRVRQTEGKELTVVIGDGYNSPCRRFIDGSGNDMSSRVRGAHAAGMDDTGLCNICSRIRKNKRVIHLSAGWQLQWRGKCLWHVLRCYQGGQTDEIQVKLVVTSYLFIFQKRHDGFETCPGAPTALSALLIEVDRSNLCEHKQKLCRYAVNLCRWPFFICRERGPGYSRQWIRHKTIASCKRLLYVCRI